ncbi:MAG: hypothetical protein AB7F22_16540 [Reyranella sp.]|uniref:hypothetical protein n=1 Tax=Reyranella sp. TaxID=1929291 RepID=UPI003D0D1864
MDADDATAGRSDRRATMRFAGISNAVREILDRLKSWKWQVFAVCAVTFVAGPAVTAFEDARRYAGTAQSDWIPTNMWLKSAECARQEGVWLAICESDRFVPISEYSHGDDPGHALILGIWAMASDSTVTLVDVARLNAVLNIVGLVVLAGFIFALGAHVTSIVLLVLGPVAYLQWMGVSPHWGLIGAASLAMILPMTLIARKLGRLSPRSANACVAIGIIGLALAALLREPIGVMCLAVTLAVIGFKAVHRLQGGRRLRDLLVIAPLVLVASAAPTWAVLARDAWFEMEPAEHVTTHNFSHTLYIGLGAVPNTLGLEYEDEVARAAVEQVAPDVVSSSPEYYRILWTLYWSALADAPAEVMRIYLEKAKHILADDILDDAPPLAIVLIVAVAHFVVLTVLGLWRRIDFYQGALVEGAALVLIGLFIAQAILAHHSRMFAMPIGIALLVLLGVLLESCWRAAVALLAPLRTRQVSWRQQ